MPLVVVVDDRATNRAVYGKLASSIAPDVEIKDFADPRKALIWLETHQPNLIIAHDDMPQMDGEEFMLRFRRMPHAAAVPIIVITALDPHMLRLRVLESSGTGFFLNAPVDHHELLRRARNLLDLRQAGAVTPEHPKKAPEKVETAKAGCRRKMRDAAAASPLAAKRPSRLSAGAAEWEVELQAELLKLPNAAGCALHLVDVEPAAADWPRTRDLERIERALRGRLRGGDWLRRVEESRFAVLQKNVVEPGDALACAERLRAIPELDAILWVGTALSANLGAVPVVLHRAALAALARDRQAGLARPVADAPPNPVPASAESCVAVASTAVNWRFLPQLDLVSGRMAGAQMLANARDEAAVRAACATAQAIEDSAPSGALALFRVSLRAPCATDGGAPAALRIAASLARSRANPALLDIEIDGLDLLEKPDHAEMELRALKTLGLHVTLGVMGVASLDIWTAPDSWLRPALLCCDRIKFEFRAADEAMVAQLGRRMEAWRTDLAIPVLAAGVTAGGMLAPLRRAGVRLAQGPCLGAPFSGGDLCSLLAPVRRNAPDIAIWRGGGSLLSAEA